MLGLTPRQADGLRLFNDTSAVSANEFDPRTVVALTEKGLAERKGDLLVLTVPGKQTATRLIALAGREPKRGRPPGAAKPKANQKDGAAPATTATTADTFFEAIKAKIQARYEAELAAIEKARFIASRLEA